MENEKLQNQEDLQSFFACVNKIKTELKDHEYLSLGQDQDKNNEVIKELEQSFVNKNFYVLFLEELMKPEDQYLKDEEVDLFVKDVHQEAEELKVLEEDLNVKELFLKEVFAETTKHEDSEKLFVELRKLVSSKKEKLEKLTRDYVENCNNHDLDNINQEALHKKLDNLMQLKSNYQKDCGYFKTQAQIIDVINSVIMEEMKTLLFLGRNLTVESFENVEELQSVQDTTSQSCSLEETSGIRIVIEDNLFEVLEISYTNDLGKHSSLEVKLVYTDQNKTTLSNIIIPNSPVNLDDLTTLAVSYNDFANFISEIQLRLSES